MKIAVAYENGNVFEHFGHSRQFKIYETDGQNIVKEEVIESEGSGHSAMAVLAMICMVAENAHAEGKWIGICGELGADLELTEEFLSMGLDELSVSPAMVLPLRKKIRETK